MKQADLIKITALSVIGLLYASAFTVAYALDNSCGTNVWTLFQLPPILGCLNDNDTDLQAQIDAIGVGGEANTASNVGSGAGIFKQKTGVDLEFKSLLGSSDIDITSQTDTITIDFNGTAGGDTTVCGNLGSGNPLHKSGSNCDAFSLIAGDGITITNTTDDYTLDVGRIGQLEHWVFQSITKTNVGTTYVDVYSANFHGETVSREIHCDNISEVFATATYDYVGTGTHSIRIVDASNNANILVERTAITADMNGAGINGNVPNHVDWVSLPAWCNTGFKVLEVQIKSTVATDDPVFYGYAIWVR